VLADAEVGTGVLSRRSFLNASAAILAVGLCAGGSRAQNTPPASGMRVALNGYDPISYFNPGHPEKGSAEFSFAFDDAVYWFKSAEHRTMFAADPERYAPQFEGFCAMTIAAGEKAEADPEAWSISDGKLFVFRTKAVIPKFNQNPTNVITQANANWPTLHAAK
jgi:YHS domain-containing protein